VQAIQIIIYVIPIAAISLDEQTIIQLATLLCETCAVVYQRAFASR